MPLTVLVCVRRICASVAMRSPAKTSTLCKKCPCYYSQLQVKNGWASIWSFLSNSHPKSEEKELKDPMKRVLLYERQGTKHEKKEYLEKLCNDKENWFEAMHKALDLVQTMHKAHSK